VGPIAAKLAAGNEEEQQYFDCLRNGILGFVKGAAPIIAVEQARRTIPLHVRPPFHECEANLKKQPATEAAAA
jgi:chemotaxis protein MotA